MFYLFLLENIILIDSLHKVVTHFINNHRFFIYLMIKDAHFLLSLIICIRVRILWLIVCFAILASDRMHFLLDALLHI